MSFLNTSEPDFYAVAWDETVSPPVCVVVGELGTILFSTGRQYADGFQVYEWKQAANPTYSILYALAFGNGLFMAVGGGGLAATSADGTAWDARETAISLDLRAVTHITGSIWVATGIQGKVIRSTDDGLSWTDITNPSGSTLYGLAYNDGVLIAVGGGGEVIVSTDDGLTWALSSSGISEDFNDIVYGPGGFYIVGNGSTILSTVDGTSFTVLSSPVVADFNAITYSGTGGLMVVVGSNGATMTSTLGAVWDGQDSGIPEANFLDVGYGDNRLVTVGAASLVAYSMTGAARPAFDLFTPISDIYRAQCFTQQDAYMCYFGMMEFEEGKWDYYPRRMRCPAPGTVDDFETIGHYFTDFPGTGAVLDAISVRGGIVVAETDQLSLLTDGGSLSLPWAYQQNFGEGLKPISNLTSFNGVAYVIADDGLIYTATSVGVNRLQGFFDLTRFEDWEPGTESAWLGFDPVYQLLFIHRQKSPWLVWLVNDDTGGVSEIELPTITVNSVDYEPRSAFIVNGLHDGIHTSYAPTSGGSDEILNVRLDLDGAILGEDETISGEGVSRYYGEISTGSFRVISVGVRGSVDEILIRTWANPDSTTRPDVAVMVKEETEDTWLTNDQPHGDITVFTDGVEGVGTAFSRYLDRGTERTISMTTPKVAARPFDMKVIHQFISMNTPKVAVRSFDMLVNYEGQTNIKLTTPKVAVRAFDMEITHDKPIDMTTPKVGVRAFDMDVTRGGYYKLPWLVDQCKVYKEDTAGTRTLAPFTKVSAFELELTTPLESYESLYINPGAVRPFVLGRVGDYILTQYGAHRISAVNTAYEVELEWYPPAECSGTYVPAQEIPAGGAEGDGKIIVGLGRGFDQLMLRILILPHGDCDATSAKILGLELGYKPTGPELKTDAGG